MDDSPETFRVLVIRLGALGDVANTIPAVAALRREIPGLRVSWLVEESSFDLVRLSGVADEVILFPRRKISGHFRGLRWRSGWRELRAVIGKLRAAAYDATLDFQGNFKSGMLSRWSRAGERVGFAPGFCREMNWLFNSVQAAPSARRLPRAEKNAALAQVLAPDLALGPVEIPADADGAAAAEAFLRGLPGHGPVVVLHPGASAFGQFKRWPAERYGHVARQLRQTRGARCVVTWGPSERDLAAQVVANSDGAAVMAPELTLAGLLELLRRADLMIACDTGPLHIAALLRRPLVALFGPKDPAIYGPYGTRCEIVLAGSDCAPCTRRRCDHVRCMMDIMPETVVGAAERMLAHSPGWQEGE